MLFVLLLRGRGRTVAAAFAGLLLVAATGYGGVLLLTHEELRSTAPKPTRSASDIPGNVYHIVLDSMRTDVFRAALERTGLAEAFAGFDLFRNNIANYVTTIPSSASYLTGTYYRAGEFADWVQQWRRDKGLFARRVRARLQDLGVRAVPALEDPARRPLLVQLATSTSWRAASRRPGFYDLIQIWLVSLAPNDLTNEALPLAARAARPDLRLDHRRDPAALDRPEIHPHAGVLMLRRLLREESLRGANGQYVYAHAALPHAPFVFDRECRYVGQPTREQTAGRTRELSRAGAVRASDWWRRFLDASQADRALRCGHDRRACRHRTDRQDRQGAAAQPAEHARRGEPRPAARAVDALLMIKRPGAEGQLRVLDTPTQLVDLFPTVMDVLGLEPGYRPDGKSVYAIRPDEPREALFAFDPDRKYGHGFVEVRVDDPDQPAALAA